MSKGVGRREVEYATPKGQISAIRYQTNPANSTTIIIIKKKTRREIKGRQQRWGKAQSSLVLLSIPMITSMIQLHVVDV